MNSQESSKILIDQDEDFVISYLQNNPSFFEHNPQLLTQINVPHSTGNAVSLIERQVSVYRNKCKDLESRLAELLELVSDHDLQNKKLFSLANVITQCNTLREYEKTIQKALNAEFSTDKIAFHYVNDKIGSCITKDPYDSDELKHILGSMEENVVICSDLSSNHKAGLFGEACDHIESAVIIALGEGNSHSLMVLGSDSSEVFSPNKGTDVLERIQKLVSAKLTNLIK